MLTSCSFQHSQFHCVSSWPASQAAPETHLVLRVREEGCTYTCSDSFVMSLNCTHTHTCTFDAKKQCTGREAQQQELFLGNETSQASPLVWLFFRSPCEDVCPFLLGSLCKEFGVLGDVLSLALCHPGIHSTLKIHSIILSTPAARVARGAAPRGPFCSPVPAPPASAHPFELGEISSFCSSLIISQPREGPRAALCSLPGEENTTWMRSSLCNDANYRSYIKTIQTRSSP